MPTLTETTALIMKGIKRQSLDNFAQLMATQHYEVPRFQRDYSWKLENWEDLWADVVALKNGDFDERYLGYLVLHQNGKAHEIIDGQQRLITISILILSFIKNLEKFEDDKDVGRKITIIKNSYITNEGMDIGQSTNKLRLNENNDDLYQSYVSGKVMSRKRLRASEKLMAECLHWFTGKIPELGFNNSTDLGKFITNIASSFYFTPLYVSNELNAYVVFETLNARGVKLTSTDLLKNYVFKTVSDDNKSLQNIELQWKRIISIIRSEDLVNFIRYFWNSRFPFVRKIDLYRAITIEKSKKSQVVSFVDELIYSAEIYKALTTVDGEYLEANEKSTQYLDALKLFSFKQVFVPLLIGKEVLSSKEFEKLLKYCVALTIRYNVICKYPPNEQEKFYNKLALLILKNKCVKEEYFKEIYPSNEEFRNYFRIIEFDYEESKRVKIARYILASIEKQLWQNKRDIPMFSSELTIEHILPRSYNKKFKLEQEEHLSMRDKLGNLTILSKSEQRLVDNSDPKDKLIHYGKSEYKITSEIKITSKHGWDRESIEQRQDWLSKIAAEVWVIPNL